MGYNCATLFECMHHQHPYCRFYSTREAHSGYSYFIHALNSGRQGSINDGLKEFPETSLQVTTRQRTVHQCLVLFLC